MQSTDFEVRKTAYSDLWHIVDFQGLISVRSPENDRVRLALIRLLEAETAASKLDKPASRTEGAAEYIFGLTQTVSALHDDRAISSLVNVMTWSGANVVQYGDKALEPVIAQLKSPDALVRFRALQVAAIILESKKDDPSRNRRVEELLRVFIKDRDAVVRRVAVREVACLSSREYYVPMLQEIAKTDPAKLPGRADDGFETDGFYFVRFEARRTIRKIQTNAPCEH